MRFLVFCLLAVTLPAAQPASKELVAELEALAKKYEAPFTQASLDRLNGDKFGVERAGRTSDLAIYNTLGKIFELQTQNCYQGRWSPALLPVKKVPAHAAVAFGAESTGFTSGVYCTVNYKATDGTFFEVTTNVPYTGDTSVTMSSSPTVKITVMKSNGGNNVVKIILQMK